MTREQIEDAASHFEDEMIKRDALSDYFTTKNLMIDFAIQQINAALEEAAKICDDGDDPNRFVARIRALKIGAGDR